ncbi:hypothetical protein HG530_001285 [Fusarium avenaceum]|nr:hypothetical protein HG530_001285 [Fusarium avenaceum]
MSTLLPNRPHLTLIIESPHITALICNRITKHHPRLGAHVLVPRRKDNLISLQLRTVRKAKTMGQNSFDLLAVLHLDLAVGDELGGANVDVVASAALEVLHQKAGAVGAAVHLEARLVETFEDLLVALGLLVAGFDSESLENRGGKSVDEEIGVVNMRTTFAVDALEADVGNGLGGNNVCAGALHHGDVVTLLEEVLSNVMSRVARAYDDGLLPLAVVLGSREFRRVTETIALEVGDALHIRHILLAGVTSGLDDVTRMECSPLS